METAFLSYLEENQFSERLEVVLNAIGTPDNTWAVVDPFGPWENAPITATAGQCAQYVYHPEPGTSSVIKKSDCSSLSSFAFCETFVD